MEDLNALDRTIQQAMAVQHVPGLAIGVTRDGETVYAKGFGTLRVGGQEPVTTDTLFHMASVTKPFVATAVVQLVEQGRVDLDLPVAHYLPHWTMQDGRYREITVRQMLSHTAGMPDVSDYGWEQPEYDDGALRRYVCSLTGASLIAAPGEQCVYSNTAFEILGDLIAEVSGETFEGYVHRYILEPLGMASSTLLMPNPVPPQWAAPHVTGPAGEIVTWEFYPYNRRHAPSSTLHSNVTDMNRWALANLNRGELEGNRILNPASYELLWNPTGSMGNVQVGLSWFLGEHNGHRTVSHSGGDTGFASNLVLVPALKLSVVVMINLLSASELTLRVSAAALDLLMGRDPAPILPDPRE